MAVTKEAVDKLLSGFLSTNKERLEEVSRSNPKLSSAVNGVLDYVAKSYGSGEVSIPVQEPIQKPKPVEAAKYSLEYVTIYDYEGVSASENNLQDPWQCFTWLEAQNAAKAIYDANAPITGYLKMNVYVSWNTHPVKATNYGRFIRVDMGSNMGDFNPYAELLGTYIKNRFVGDPQDGTWDDYSFGDGNISSKEYALNDGKVIYVGLVVAFKSKQGRYSQFYVIDVADGKVYLENIETSARTFVDFDVIDIGYETGNFKIGLWINPDTTLRTWDEVEYKSYSGNWIKYTIEKIGKDEVFFKDSRDDSISDLTFESVRKWWKEGDFRFPPSSATPGFLSNDELILGNGKSLKPGDYYIVRYANYFNIYQILEIDIDKDEVIQKNLMIPFAKEGVTTDYIIKLYDGGSMEILSESEAKEKLKELEELESKKTAIAKNDEIDLSDGKRVVVGDYYWQPKYDYIYKIEGIDVDADELIEVDILTGKKETDVSVGWFKTAYYNGDLSILTKKEAEDLAAEKKKQSSTPVSVKSNPNTIIFPDGVTLINVGDYIMLTNTGEVLRYEKIDKKARIVYFEDVESGKKGVQYYLSQIINRWDEDELEILDDNAVKQYMSELEEKQEQKKAVAKKEKPAEEKKKRGRPAKSTGLYIPTDKNELKELITSTEILVQYDKTYKEYLKELKDAYKKMLS